MRNLVVATLFLLGQVACSAHAKQAAPAMAPDAAPWQAQFAPRAASNAVSKHSVYITMPDKVRLAADIYMPKGLPVDARVPTLLVQTRYYRAVQLRSNPDSCNAIVPFIGYFAARGYAVVYVDVRGTGASFGTRRGELSPQEISDGGALIDWIVAQPWSSGAVGAFGQSYLGSAAELLILNGRKALKAVAPVSAAYDPYADLFYPGGIQNATFRTGWSALNKALDSGHPDRNPRLADGLGPCPVDGDAGGALRDAAILEHADNFESGAATAAVKFRDDPAFVRGFPMVADVQARLNDLAVPMLSIEATQDSAYARSGISRQINSTSPVQRLILAAGNHGAHAFYGPGTTSPVASAFDQDAELLAFLDHYVAGKDNGYDKTPRVRWFVTGANVWRSADAWPQPSELVRYCFAAKGALSQHCTGSRKLAFTADNADAGLDTNTRWNTTVSGGPVFYQERSAADARLLTFTSAVLTKPIEVTGSPVVTLKVIDSARNGDFFVYLEEVEPDGRAFIVGEGELRASMRIGAVGYRTLAPTPAGTRASQRGETAGTPLTLSIGLIPFAHRFAAGARLRVAIAASDKANFGSGSTIRRWSVDLGANESGIALPEMRPLAP